MRTQHMEHGEQRSASTRLLVAKKRLVDRVLSANALADPELCGAGESRESLRVT